MSPKPSPMMERAQRHVDERKAAGLLRALRRASPLPGGRIELDGVSVLDLCSNDPLALRNDSRLAKGAQKALERYGTGAGASRLITGTHPLHLELEEALAGHFGAPAALVFASGYQANLALCSTLFCADDTVWSDALNHASLIDGLRLSRAQVRQFAHGDPSALEEESKGEPPAGVEGIVTEGLFSMDGDRAPLEELLRWISDRDGVLVVDEAHAFGVVGEGGRGVSFEAGVADSVLRVGTLSKALGSQGGFVLGSEELRCWLLNEGRSFVYSTALAPPCAGAALEALGILEREPGRGEGAREAGARFRALLAKGGITTAGLDHIVPVVVGSTGRCLALAEALLARGVGALAIRPPTVPEGTARIRFSFRVDHEISEVERASEVLLDLLHQGE